MGEAFIAFVPKLLLGLCIFIVGFILAKVVRYIVSNLGKKLKLDVLSEKVGISDLLGKFGLRTPLTKVLAAAIFWVIILYFLKSAGEILGAKDISAFVNAVFTFMPKLMVSIFILLAGLLAADLLRGLIETGLDGMGIEYSGLVARSVYGLFGVIILTVVLGQLGVETELINASMKIVLGAIGLAVALALGLGLRPIVQNVISGVYARDLFPPGSDITIDEAEATVVEVGAVATRLETSEGRFLIVPNSRLVSKVTKGRYKASALPKEKSH